MSASSCNWLSTVRLRYLLWVTAVKHKLCKTFDIPFSFSWRTKNRTDCLVDVDNSYLIACSHHWHRQGKTTCLVHVGCVNNCRQDLVVCEWTCPVCVCVCVCVCSIMRWDYCITSASLTSLPSQNLLPSSLHVTHSSPPMHTATWWVTSTLYNTCNLACTDLLMNPDHTASPMSFWATLRVKIGCQKVSMLRHFQFLQPIGFLFHNWHSLLYWCKTSILHCTFIRFCPLCIRVLFVIHCVSKKFPPLNSF